MLDSFKALKLFNLVPNISNLLFSNLKSFKTPQTGDINYILIMVFNSNIC